MLPVLVTATLAMSLALLFLRRDQRSLLLFLAVGSVSFFLYTISVYIAKKGGITEFTTFVLFGTNGVRQHLLKQVYTVHNLGFMMALGRYLSPYFLLLSALDLSGKSNGKRGVVTALLLSIIPLLSIVLYMPQVFELISSNEWMMEAVVNFSKMWIIVYILSADILMVVEFFFIKLQFFRIRFLMKLMFILSLSVIYGVFFPQDPAQVYLFYRNEYMWMLGLWYLHKGFSTGIYYVVVAGSLCAGLVSMASLIRYFSITFGEEVAEVKIRRESSSATRGVSMFVHGTKNDLLATRILLEKVGQNYPQDQEVKKLKAINDGLMGRLDKLNKAIKVNSIKLYPVEVKEILDLSLQRIRETFSSYPIDVKGLDSRCLILADRNFLSEAFTNIIQNGIEATVQNGSRDPIEICVEDGRVWVEIIFSDRGKGIDKKGKKHIWEPFHSSKNSSTNWGIGMYFTRLVVRRHMGSISFSRRKEGGTSFVVMLPKAGKGDR